MNASTARKHSIIPVHSDLICCLIPRKNLTHAMSKDVTKLLIILARSGDEAVLKYSSGREKRVFSQFSTGQFCSREQRKSNLIG